MRKSAEIATAAALACWVVATFVSQHPNPVFSTLRKRWDPYSAWIPNWRFFAPNPASMDFHLIVRFSIAGEISEWAEIRGIPERRIVQSVWFPSRRIDKGLFDVIGRFFGTLDDLPFHYTEVPDYAILRNYVSNHISEIVGPKAESFQFAIVRDAGYDATVDAEPLFISRNETIIANFAQSAK